LFVFPDYLPAPCLLPAVQAAVEEQGVRIQTGTRRAKSINIQDLLEEFKAQFELQKTQLELL
jgi:hypothetical protein